jgi:hypothetical protein
LWQLLSAALDLRQDFVDHDVFRGGFAERGIQPQEKVSDAFSFSAEQSYARIFSDGGQCRVGSAGFHRW